MRVHYIARGWADGRLIFEERIEMEEEDLERLIPEIAIRHVDLLPARHMIELENLDEPNPLDRFFRFGTDQRGMVDPIGIDLRKLPS